VASTEGLQATCAAALKEPNLNYVHGTELSLKPNLYLTFIIKKMS